MVDTTVAGERIPALTEDARDVLRPGAGAVLGPRIPALRNGIAMLRYIATKSRPVPAAAISRKLGIPRSSTYQLLQVLVDAGLVVHIPEEQGYKLGVGVFELGSAYIRHQPLEHLARPILVRIVQQLRLTTHLGILHGTESLYLLKEQPARQMRLVTEVGVRLPAHLTATGRAMLSQLPREQLLALYPADDRFVDRTGRGPRNLNDLRALLSIDRKRGWAVEDGSVTDNVTCIAAASTDHMGLPVSSFSVSFASSYVPRDQWEHIAESLRDAARQLTKRLGGT